MTYTLDCIDHVQIAAPEGSETIARDFYGRILGMEEVEKPASLQKNGGVWFRISSIELHVGIEASFQPQKKAHPAFRVQRLDALKRHLQLANMIVQEDSRLPGANRFYTEDPFGNRIEFLEWIDELS